jgi:hypothetical protein
MLEETEDNPVRTNYPVLSTLTLDQSALRRYQPLLTHDVLLLVLVTPFVSGVLFTHLDILGAGSICHSLLE